MDPEITCPADVTLEAPADTSPSNTGTASATDNSLTPPAIASMDDGPLDPDGTGFINRTWTATDDTGNSSQCVQAIAVKPVLIEIDIKPGSDPNGVNPKSMGLAPYAILGTDDFDVTTVDVTTLGFGPGGAQPAHDLTRPGIYAGHLVDVNDDGLTDLVVHVVQKQAELVKGDTEACVFGATLDGVPFLGCDSIKTAGK